MDKAYLKDLLNSLRAELVRFRYLCVVLFIAVSFLLLFLGITWPKKFTTSAVLFADQTTIIEPLLKGSAEMTKIDRSEELENILERVLNNNEDLQKLAQELSLEDK